MSWLGHLAGWVESPSRAKIETPEGVLPMTWKPAAYPSVSPYLLVRDAEATLAFLSTVFGAGRLRVIHRADGSVMHAEARIDDCAS